MAVIGWQGDVGRLTFGVELERFMFREDGAVPTRADITALYDALLAHGFAPGPLDPGGELTAVCRDTPSGPVVIKNDFCTHIFEVAYPPMREVDELRALYRETAALTSALLHVRGLVILPGGSLDQVPEGIIIVASDSDTDRHRVLTLMERPIPQRPFTHRLFPAAMTSTHVHANILDEDFFPRLPAYYAAEYLAPLLYSNSPTFLGRRAHAVRPLMYRDGFAPSYLANAIPEPIPVTPEDYAAMRAASEGYVRDYTFVTPTRHGTVEFRSGCSQDTLEEIVGLLALRVATVVGVSAGYWAPRALATFWRACETGYVYPPHVEQDLRALARVRADLPEDFARALADPLARLAQVRRAWRAA